MAKYEIKDGVGIIPEGTECINSYAFEDCKELTSVVIPKTVTRISWNAFDGCTGLTSIVIPNSVTEIENQAFRGCTGLTGIIIPESVKKIDLSAFEACTGITSIVIPKSVREIGWKSSFFGCKNLTSIVVAEGNEKYDSRENCNAIIETDKNALIAGVAGDIGTCVAEVADDEVPQAFRGVAVVHHLLQSAQVMGLAFLVFMQEQLAQKKNSRNQQLLCRITKSNPKTKEFFV